MPERAHRAALRFFILATCLSPAVLAQPTVAPRYSTHQIGQVVELVDSRSQVTVSIIPSAGNLAVEMKVKGHISDIATVGGSFSDLLVVRGRFCTQSRPGQDPPIFVYLGTA